MLLTDSVQLQGEWIEAVDVEEYLEERGIQLHSGVSRGGVFLGESEHRHDAQNSAFITQSDLATQDLGREKSQQRLRGIEDATSVEEAWFFDSISVVFTVG